MIAKQLQSLHDHGRSGRLAAALTPECTERGADRLVCVLQHIYLVKEKLIKPHAHRGTTLFELLPAGELEAKQLMSQVSCVRATSPD